MTLAIEPTSGIRPEGGPDARALAQRMTELKAQARDMGYFNVPLLEQALRIVEVIASPIIAFALLTQGGVLAVIGALVLAMNFPRGCYVAHDIAHGQWGLRSDAKPRYMLNLIALTQGFGAAWWVEKHELHHAFPNGCRVDDEGVMTPIDGDIDTAPWLVWDKVLTEFNNRARTTSLHKLVGLVMPRLQVAFFFPLLSMARFNWSAQSILKAFSVGKNLEGALCVAHWVLYFTLAGYLTPGPAWTGWAWLIFAEMLGGLILALVFVLNHTGMEVYDAKVAGGFYDRQARSTRNTPTSLFHDWLTGGLNSQIEHHMFPTMARRNLPKMREATRRAMTECGYAYEEMGNDEAMHAVLNALGEAARA